MNTKEVMELEMEDQEQVSGSTVNEFSELQQAMFENPTLSGTSAVGAHIPLTNTLGVDAIKGVLRNHGIAADISLGFLGTGIGSSPNKYTNTETNEQISHQDVLNILMTR